MLAFMKAIALAAMMTMLVEAAPVPGSNNLVSSEKREAKEFYGNEFVPPIESVKTHRAKKICLRGFNIIKAPRSKEIYPRPTLAIKETREPKELYIRPALAVKETHEGKEIYPRPTLAIKETRGVKELYAHPSFSIKKARKADESVGKREAEELYPIDFQPRSGRN